MSPLPDRLVAYARSDGSRPLISHVRQGSSSAGRSEARYNSPALRVFIEGSNPTCPSLFCASPRFSEEQKLRDRSDVGDSIQVRSLQSKRFGQELAASGTGQMACFL
jgi:hypothetical protein